MRRIIAILSATVVLLLAGGFLALGAFPPGPPVRPVHVDIAAGTLAPT